MYRAGLWRALKFQCFISQDSAHMVMLVSSCTICELQLRTKPSEPALTPCTVQFMTYYCLMISYIFLYADSEKRNIFLAMLMVEANGMAYLMHYNMWLQTVCCSPQNNWLCAQVHSTNIGRTSIAEKVLCTMLWSLSIKQDRILIH